jgi:homoserine dehydrogenase
MLASVSGVFNAVMVNSDLADSTLYYGRGAGRLPTASTVLGDICDIARNLTQNAPHRLAAVPATGETVTIKPIAQTSSRYYLRLIAKDSFGIADEVRDLLQKNGVEVESRSSKDITDNGVVSVVIVTQDAVDSDVTAAVKEIDALDAVDGSTVKLRIMA